MKNFILGLLCGLLLGGSAFAFSTFDDEGSSTYKRRSPDPLDQKLEPIDDYWFLKSLDKNKRNPC